MFSLVRGTKYSAERLSSKCPFCFLTIIRFVLFVCMFIWHYHPITSVVITCLLCFYTQFVVFIRYPLLIMLAKWGHFNGNFHSWEHTVPMHVESLSQHAHGMAFICIGFQAHTSSLLGHATTPTFFLGPTDCMNCVNGCVNTTSLTPVTCGHCYKLHHHCAICLYFIQGYKDPHNYW